MASDIMAQAAIATNDVDLQTQLGLKSFLQGCAQKHWPGAASPSF